MTTWPRCLSATSRHHASCTLDVSIFMPMFWVTQHPTITPIRSPPSSYPLADTIIYSIFIMLLSIIPASCKWPHPGYSGNLEMTRLWNFIIIMYFVFYCIMQLVHHCKSSTNYLDRAVSPMCKKLQHSRTTGGPQPWMCTTTMSADDLDLEDATTAAPDKLRCHWLLIIGYICDNINCVSSVFWNINVIYCITDIHGTADSITWVLSNLVDIIMLSPSWFHSKCHIPI